MNAQLAVISPSGICLAIDVLLTGRIDLGADGTVASVEVSFIAACSRLQSDGLHVIKGPSLFSPRAEKALWVKPEDLCAGGVPVKHEELIAEAARVRDQVERRAQYGVLGPDWP
jgi:hypothetical protein